MANNSESDNWNKRIKGIFDKRQVTPYNETLHIRNLGPKSFKRFYEEGSTKGLPADTTPKLRAMFAVLDYVNEADELRAWPL